MRRVREGGTIHPMWETLSEPWRACVELAWEAYRAHSLPIGAVVADADGRLLVSGRNRIHESSGPADAVFGHSLAHAELNALLSFDHVANDPRACVLYTTTEPCPLCAGAMGMTDIAELRYASREPWAGSAAMFETVPYLRRRNVRVLGPEDGRLETVLVALQVERFLRLRPGILEGVVRLYEEVMPEATRAGKRVYRSGLLRAMSEDGAPSQAVIRALYKEISSVT